MNDEEGGIWIGTESSGLAHLKYNGTWNFYHTMNSNLPTNAIQALQKAEKGKGIWIGGATPYCIGCAEKGGVYYLSENGELTVYTQFDSGLPSNEVYSLQNEAMIIVWSKKAVGEFR